MILSSLVNDFLEYLKIERGASQKTIQNYDHYLRRFLEFARSTSSGQAGDVTPSVIDLDLVRKYRLYLYRWEDPKSKKNLKKVTQNYFMIALRAFLRYLDGKGIDVLTAEEVKLGKNDVSPIKVLDVNALERLLKAPDVRDKSGLRDKTLLEIIFSTGLRVSEVAVLNKDTVNLNNRKFSIIGKGHKERTVLLSEPAASWLERYLKSRKDSFKPLFIRYQGKVEPEEYGEKMRLTPRSIQRIVEKYVKSVGLPIKATPHTLRHNFARKTLEKGEDLQSLQYHLGHQHLSSTQVYAQLGTSGK